MAHDIFISYSSKDKHIADAVCSALENNKIRCWIAPRDVIPGREWGEAIVEAIGQSRIMVLIFSSAANSSQQVLREVERAVNKNVIIVPFRIEDVVPTKSMEYFLYSTHWLDALTPDMEAHIECLVDTLGKLIPQHQTENNRKVPASKAKSPIIKNIMFLAAGIALSMTAFGVFQWYDRSTESAKANLVSTGSIESSGKKSLTPNDQVKPAGEDVSNKRTDGKTEEKLLDKETSDQDTGDNSPMNNSKSSELGTEAVSREEVKQGSTTSLQDEKPSLKIGEYIRFGTFNGAMIDWRVIHIDSKGSPLLLAAKILTMKSFDAAESGTYNKTGTGIEFDVHRQRSKVYTDYSETDLRKMKGSNYWANSNLREWLNSTERRVSFHSQPPVPAAVARGMNGYENEPGFLHNFSEKERGLIKPVSHKVLLPSPEKGSKDGGSASYSLIKEPVGEAIVNYDQAFYKNIQDKVFLLSVKEAEEYLYDRGWDLKTSPTKEAIDRDKSNWYKELKGQYGGYHMWWLCTPRGDSPSDVCIVAPAGDEIYTDYATMAGGGVRPALYLNPAGLSLSGEGSESDPYIIK
ncbi:MAG: toll/interleukin-1 receptor domain-containing protein [Clostridia bacterium]|nr:toll/interleukin-1 receptor domain-containing protein [Clostridia bacterium]